MMRLSRQHVTKPKLLYCLSMIALLVCTNGCISNQVVTRARGYTDERVEPLKGDQVFSHGGVCYVTQGKHPKGHSAEKMDPSDLKNSHEPYYAFKPCPGCYSLLLLTAPMDAVTLPFQALALGFVWFVMRQGWHGC